MDGKKVTNKLTEISFSAGSALVGFAIGGPVGATIGGALPPALQMVNSLWEDYKARQRLRLTNIVETAFTNCGMTDEQIFEKLHLNPQLTDDVIRMIRQMEGTDSELDAVFSTLISSVITENEKERRRLVLLYDSIKGMNKVQVELLNLMYEAGGILSAEDMAKNTGVPEVELRNSVRDLELRGMIIDNGEEPTIWELRELGLSIAKLYHKKKGETEDEVLQ